MEQSLPEQIIEWYITGQSEFRRTVSRQKAKGSLSNWWANQFDKYLMEELLNGTNTKSNKSGMRSNKKDTSKEERMLRRQRSKSSSNLLNSKRRRSYKRTIRRQTVTTNER